MKPFLPFALVLLSGIAIPWLTLPLRADAPVQLPPSIWGIRGYKTRVLIRQLPRTYNGQLVFRRGKLTNSDTHRRRKTNSAKWGDDWVDGVPPPKNRATQWFYENHYGLRFSTHDSRDFEWVRPDHFSPWSPLIFESLCYGEAPQQWGQTSTTK